MPEGHTIHRLARRQAADLIGQTVAVSSPQAAGGSTVRAAAPAGRAAALLDGRRLTAIDAYGKHLLHRYDGDLTLHVHLGLFGRFVRRADPDGVPARETCRLRVRGDAVAWDLSGAVASKLLEPPEEDALLARLGPDPLRRDADPERFAAALTRRRIPIAAALMDQTVLAGVGNVYRAESLFATGLDPFLPAREVPATKVTELWDVLRVQLRDGERAGKIVTVPTAETGGVARSKLRGRDRVQVYRRAACRRCAGDIEHELLAGRTLWWCPACQPSDGPR
ncbi:Endonuclease 8 1 [Paraconexibacter sp. AEG42_29]|uniref:DNA-(apurinic or apyrimidinic site) lyase n=1 Tax=Paraconexibacter sp. AEG42_29 TaxID=2997339 RepID=A0AAU7AR12_9ACTN